MKGYILTRVDDGRLTPFVAIPELGLDEGTLVKIAVNRLGGASLMVYASELEARVIASFYDDAEVVEIHVGQLE